MDLSFFLPIVPCSSFRERRSGFSKKRGKTAKAAISTRCPAVSARPPLVQPRAATNASSRSHRVAHTWHGPCASIFSASGYQPISFCCSTPDELLSHTCCIHSHTNHLSTFFAEFSPPMLLSQSSPLPGAAAATACSERAMKKRTRRWPHLGTLAGRSPAGASRSCAAVSAIHWL